MKNFSRFLRILVRQYVSIAVLSSLLVLWQAYSLIQKAPSMTWDHAVKKSFSAQSQIFLWLIPIALALSLYDSWRIGLFSGSERR